MSRATTYWHGGARGLTVGDQIVPAVELDRLPATYLADFYDSDPTRVHMTSDHLLGRSYASQFCTLGGGDLYEVEPVGELVEDPDYLGLGVSWTAPRALIVAVVETDVRITPTEYARATGRHQRWDDGNPVYSPDGYFLPTPASRALGVTAADLRGLGQWVPLELVDAAARHYLRTGVMPPVGPIELAEWAGAMQDGDAGRAQRAPRA